jgi:hypothetical protein
MVVRGLKDGRRVGDYGPTPVSIDRHEQHALASPGT